MWRPRGHYGARLLCLLNGQELGKWSWLDGWSTDDPSDRSNAPEEVAQNQCLVHSGIGVGKVQLTRLNSPAIRPAQE